MAHMIATKVARRCLAWWSVFALAGLGLSMPAAKAECIAIGPGFHPDQNDSITMNMTCDLAGAKGWRNIPGPGYVMTGISIASESHNGTLKTWGARSWSYTPKALGSDTFVTRQCATLNGSASGCSTLTYNMTIRDTDPDVAKRFRGKWSGRWDSALPMSLEVTSVVGDKARVTYTWLEGSSRDVGVISGSTLTIPTPKGDAFITLTVTEPDEGKAGGNFSSGRMTANVSRSAE